MRVRTTVVIGALTTLFLIAPFVVILGASFDTGNAFQIRFPPHGISLARYFDIGPKYVSAFQTSLMLGLIVSLLATAIGLMAALGLARGRIGNSVLLQSFFRLPIQIPLVVTGAAYLQFFYQFMSVAGVNPMNSLVGLILAHLFVALPYTIGAISAILSRVDPCLDEAAESLGATKWTTFWRVTFPTLRPGLIVGAFYAFIISFGDVPIAVFLVTSKNMTIPVQIFQDMLFDFQPSILAVSSLIALICVFLIILVQKVTGLDMVLPSKQRPR